MLTTESPIYLHNLQTGAPTLDGLAGSLVSVLDSCLVTGFGLQTATITVASGVATLSTPSSHGFALHQVALVDGASNALLNGRHRVLSRTSATITFDATGVPDGAASGSINVRLAPAGWSKVFSGTNKAVYRSNNVAGTQMYLRVDDTVGRNARVVGYETMTDVDTGERPFPTAAQRSGGGWWPKSNLDSSSSRAWTVVADDRQFFLHIGTGSNTGASGSVWMFGDFASYKIGDAFSCAVMSAPSDVTSISSEQSGSVEYCNSATPGPVHVARSYAGIVGAVQALNLPESYSSTSSITMSGAGYGAVSVFPNGPDSGLVLSRKAILEPGVCLRGVITGAYVSPQNCHASYSRNTIQDGSSDLSGRKLLAVKCGSPASNSSQGVMFFDITGPWVYGA